MILLKWKTWSDIFGMNSSSVSAWFFRYFMFIFWSVIYATFIVILVVGSAPYASGSGKYAIHVWFTL